MDSLFNIVLSSAVVAALVKGIEQNQVNKLNMITSKRGDWRKELKDIALDIKKSNVDNINEYLTQLKINLNYYGSVNCKNKKDEDLDIVQDEHIWKVIYEIEDYCANEQKDIEKFEEYKKRLIDYIGLLLKFDWDRSKYETNSAFDFMSSIIFLLAVGVGGVLLYYWQNPKMTIYEIISDGMMFVLPSFIMIIPMCIQRIDSNLTHNWYKNIGYYRLPLVFSTVFIIVLVYVWSIGGITNAILELLYLLAITYPTFCAYKSSKVYSNYEDAILQYMNYDKIIIYYNKSSNNQWKKVAAYFDKIDVKYVKKEFNENILQRIKNNGKLENDLKKQIDDNKITWIMIYKKGRNSLILDKYDKNKLEKWFNRH